MAAFGTVFFGVMAFTFAAIIAGLVLHKFIGMYLLNELSPIVSIVVIGLYVGLILSLVTLKLVVAIALLVPLAVMLVLPDISNRKAGRDIDEDMIGQFRDAIESDPRNLAARSRLAQYLHKTGNLDEAIEQLMEVVRIMPSSIEDAHRLRTYLTEHEQGIQSIVVCPACRKQNPTGRTRCYSCESPLNLSASLATWLRSGAKWQIVVSSLVTVLAAAIVMSALKAVPLAVRVVAVIVIISMSAGIGIHRLRQMR